jgi:hypothetical protein
MIKFSLEMNYSLNLLLLRINKSNVCIAFQLLELIIKHKHKLHI